MRRTFAFCGEVVALHKAVKMFSDHDLEISHSLLLSSLCVRKIASARQGKDAFQLCCQDLRVDRKNHGRPEYAVWFFVE